jgi:hypothetical protein
MLGGRNEERNGGREDRSEGRGVGRKERMGGGEEEEEEGRNGGREERKEGKNGKGARMVAYKVKWNVSLTITNIYIYILQYNIFYQ